MYRGERCGSLYECLRENLARGRRGIEVKGTGRHAREAGGGRGARREARGWRRGRAREISANLGTPPIPRATEGKTTKKEG